MTKEQFEKFWISTFPDTLPISHLFKFDYKDRWFRIHSLPKSKRYADNENEWEILLSRQNQIINDLLGDNSDVFIVTGEYNWGERETFITDEEKVFDRYNFTRLSNIDLFKLNPDDYDEGEVYRPAFSQIVWHVNNHDNILTEIADDCIRVFFVSFEKHILIAPYDGGLDIVLSDIETKEKYKQKYQDWLSQREDGF
ncbi:MAG: hypothetical protein KDD03_00970 [Gelidibacter sp.]|nr:hypothetical protein [Gelidibacter sp.]